MKVKLLLSNCKDRKCLQLIFPPLDIKLLCFTSGSHSFTLRATQLVLLSWYSIQLIYVAPNSNQKPIKLKMNPIHSYRASSKIIFQIAPKLHFIPIPRPECP